MNKTVLLVGLVVVLVVVGFVYMNFINVGSPSPGDKTATDSYSSSTQDISSSTPIVNISSTSPKSMHKITLNTNMGAITFQTYDEDAPKTVENFITLANKGFYNNVTFHRVIKGFMIQGGDPSGNGTGGPGYTFPDELNPATPSYQAGYKKGVVAMANAGPNTNGSQFFIMHQDYLLPNAYTIFGKVIEGQDVVDAIASVPTGAGDKPVSPVVIKSVTVTATTQ